MRRAIKGMIIIICVVVFYLPASEIKANDPPGPPGQHDQSGDQDPGGGGAPITGGLALLLIMGVAYGLKKWYKKEMEGAIEE